MEHVDGHGPDDPPKPLDFENYLDFLERYGHNFIRLWTGNTTTFMDTRQHVLLGKGRMDQWDGVRLVMGATRHLADQIVLVTMLPQPELSSTTYCLASPGNEYVIYQPQNGPFSVRLKPGNYSIQWRQPTERSTPSKITLQSTGGDETMTPPSAGPIVLLITRREP